MLKWIKEILKINSSIRPYKKIARLDIGGNRQVFNILSYLYKDSTEFIRLERKYNKFKKCEELFKYQEQHRKETWINNLGPYIRNNISADRELPDQ